MELLEKAIDRPLADTGDSAFEDLYEKAFPPFARFAAKKNASFEDARDIFHDALVIYHEKRLQKELSIRVAPEAYVIGIAKHLWIRKFHSDRKSISLTNFESDLRIPTDYYPSVNETRLLRLVETAGSKCMDLLRKFYYDKTPLRQIATLLGYRTEHSAAVQKFKCISKMRELIRSKAMHYEDFLHQDH